jgi:hypothetical protein
MGGLFDEVAWAAVAGGGLALLLLLVLLRTLTSRGEVPSIVLREYEISRTATEGAYVLISGRPEGFLSWLLTVIGLGTDIRFEVTRTAIRRDMESNSWRLIDSVPLPNVSSTQFGSTKSLLSLVLAFAFLVCGIGGFVTSHFARFGESERQVVIFGAIGCAALGVLFLLAYLLSKRLVVQVETAGGRLIGVRFKPSILGRLNIDLDKAEEAGNIIDSLIARYAAGNISRTT